MDGKWILPILPTEHVEEDSNLSTEFGRLFPEFKKLTPESQPMFVDQVRSLTTQLKKHCYCPSTWTSRAYNLLRLGFPELAIGDAFKAQILINIFLNEEPHRRDVAKELWRQAKTGVSYLKSGLKSQTENKELRIIEYAKRNSDRAAMILAQALFKAHCYVECHEFLKEYFPKADRDYNPFKSLKALAERACVIEDVTRMQDKQWVEQWNKASLEEKRSGTIVPRVYPWMTSYIQRTGMILEAAKTKVRESASDKCFLGTSTIACTPPSTHHDVQAADGPNTFGIFARQDFAIDQTVMIDKTFLSGVDDQMRRCSCCRGRESSTKLLESEALCCGALFCSEDCKDRSMAEYHFSECMDFEDIKSSNLAMFTNYASEDTIAMNDLLYRVLAHAEHSPCLHPLRVPAVGAMTPATHSNQPVLFSVLNDIQRPLEMLKTLEVNIFKEHAYDTWVIQTIQARIRNNVRVYEDDFDNYHAALNLSFMFFNHSCEPNVDIEIDSSGSSNIVVKATRQIKAGEELFITYIDDEDLELPHDERQDLLKDWIKECQCRRCSEERHSEKSPPLTALEDDDLSDPDFRIDEDGSVTSSPDSQDSMAEEHHAITSIRTIHDRTWARGVLDRLDWDTDIYVPESPSESRKRRRII